MTVDKAFEVATLLYTVWPWDNANLLATADSIVANAMEQSSQECWVVWDGTRAVAHAKSFARSIRSDTSELPVMALAGVCVDPPMRGQGLGEMVVQASFRRVDEKAFPLSLFQTGVPRFYEKFGARQITNQFVDRTTPNLDTSPWWEDHVMIYPGDAIWPEGVIDLNGAGY